MKDMTKVVNINSRGSLTLPKNLRQRLGVKDGGQVVVEERPDGLLLRPSATFPVEIYTKERLAEFEKSNERALAGFKFRRRKK